MIVLKSIITLLFLSGVLLVAPTSCRTKEANEPVSPAPAQTLVSSSLIGEYSASQLRSRYTGLNSIFQALIVRGISVHRLEYRTTNTDGKTVTASGALIIPDGATAAPLLSMQHGTIAGDSEAPSYFRSGSEAYTFGTVFASQGYIIAAPDYIGYGASKDLPHTYDQRTGLAAASLDMLRAAREFMSKNNVNWDKRLYLAGYSEGGYATMALQKKIEEETGDEFSLVASSCGAGAYDKTAFMKQVINERTSGIASINELYVWVLLTYDRIYGLNRSMTYYFKEPYAAQVAARGKEAVINVSLDQAFTDSFKKAINDGTDQGFLNAVKDNDIYDWKPRTPTQLYHGDADKTVLYLNSVNARDAMHKRGATNVELKTIRGGTHATSILSFITGTYSFFGNTQ